MNAMLAVVPAVEGSPLLVLAQLGKSAHMSFCVFRNPSRIAFSTRSSFSDQKFWCFTMLSIKCS